MSKAVVYVTTLLVAAVGLVALGFAMTASQHWAETYQHGVAFVSSTDGDEPTDIAWQDIRLVIGNRCTTCHAEPGPEADLNLELPQIVQREALSGRLLDRINDPEDPMPPKGMLPQETREMIAEGVRQGASTVATDRPARRPPGSRVRARVLEPIAPFGVTDGGSEFLTRMQGHWIGSMNLMGQDMPWFAFDYRAVGPSQVHGIFEGGTMRNLMTSFFYARIHGTDTLVARNGGVLNGIYRTSYFVLDEVTRNGGATKYRFVDAIGGKDLMWMSLEFKGASIEWRAYTSGLGEQPEPTLHMSFKAKRRATQLSEDAAQAFNFSARQPMLDLPEGFPMPQ